MASKKPLRVQLIPFASVQLALDSSSPYEPQRQFNTHEHSIDEITAVVPDLLHREPGTLQPFELLSPWLSLICASQQIDLSSVHRIRLPSWYCDLLIDARKTWSVGERITNATEEDLRVSFPQSTVGRQNINSLFANG